MTISDILNKYVGNNIPPEAVKRMIVDIQKYGLECQAQGQQEGQEVIETFRRLLSARDEKIRSLESRIERIKKEVNL